MQKRGLIRIPSGKVKPFLAPTRADAQTGNASHWTTVQPATLARFRSNVVISLRREAKTAHTIKDIRVCKEHFKIVAGEVRPWEQCVWRNPKSGRHKLVYFP